jgi:hypothetical protein
LEENNTMHMASKTVRLPMGAEPADLTFIEPVMFSLLMARFCPIEDFEIMAHVGEKKATDEQGPWFNSSGSF